MSSADITSEEFLTALLEYRNTSRSDERSPNDVVFGRNLRSLIPTHRTAFTADWTTHFEELDKIKPLVLYSCAILPFTRGISHFCAVFELFYSRNLRIVLGSAIDEISM